MTLTQVNPKKNHYTSLARRLRVSAGLTRQQVADLAGVPFEHVSLFERGFPILLDSKRRLYRELWARKCGK